MVRIVDASGNALGPRLAEDWSLAGLAQSMRRGLQASRRPVPVYLELLADESAARQRGTERAIFGME